MRVAAPHLVDSIVKFDEGVRKRAGRPVTARGMRARVAIGLDAQVKSAGTPAKPPKPTSSSAQLLKL